MTQLLTVRYRTLLGFDFGTRSIGVAAGQSITQTASPLIAVSAKHGLPIWEQLDPLLKEWRPEALVVGIPLAVNNSELSVTAAAKSFAKMLKERYQLPVYGIDEHLTTRSAKAELFAGGGFKALKKAHIDSLSAKIILETWFTRKPEQITIF